MYPWYIGVGDPNTLGMYSAIMIIQCKSNKVLNSNITTVYRNVIQSEVFRFFVPLYFCFPLSVAYITNINSNWWLLIIWNHKKRMHHSNFPNIWIVWCFLRKRVVSLDKCSCISWRGEQIHSVQITEIHLNETQNNVSMSRSHTVEPMGCFGCEWWNQELHLQHVRLPLPIDRPPPFTSNHWKLPSGYPICQG